MLLGIFEYFLGLVGCLFVYLGAFGSILGICLPVLAAFWSHKSSSTAPWPAPRLEAWRRGTRPPGRSPVRDGPRGAGMARASEKWTPRPKSGCGCQSRFGIPLWLVGEFTHVRTYSSGWIGMFTGGTIWILTHSQMPPPFAQGKWSHLNGISRYLVPPPTLWTWEKWSHL